LGFIKFLKTVALALYWVLFFSCIICASPILSFTYAIFACVWPIKNFGCAICSCALKFFIFAPTSV